MQLLGRKAIGRTRCPDVRALLPSYVERELGGEDRERVSGHLQQCSSCREEERGFHASLGALSVAEAKPAPGYLYAGFSARLDAYDNIYRRRTLRLRLAGAAACLLLVTAVGARPLLQRMLIPADIETGKMVKSSLPRPAGITQVKPENQVAKNVESAPTNNDSEIVLPAPLETVPIKRAPKIVRPERIADNFLDIQPKVGASARIQFASGGSVEPRAGTDVPPAIPERFESHGTGPGLIAERDERIKVGDSVTTVRTGYRLDDEGRRMVVNVNIGTTSVP